VLDKRSAFHQIARRVATNGKLRKKNQPSAGSLSIAGKADDFSGISRKISDRGIDLAERDFHKFSLKRGCAVAKLEGRLWELQRESF